MYLTRQLKLLILNVFVDIGKALDIAVSQLYFDVMNRYFCENLQPINNAKVYVT